MKKTIFLCLFFASACLSAFSQELSTELDKRNGFKDIKLGQRIDSIRGAKFKKDIKEKEEYPAKLYIVEHPDYDKIGEVKVQSIELKTYKDLIYQIMVIAHKDTRLMKGMETALGKAMYDVRTEQYHWKGKNVSLTFKSHDKHNLEMIYRYAPVLRMMRIDKDQKIDDIANDF